MRNWLQSLNDEWRGLAAEERASWEVFANRANEYSGEGSRGPTGYGWHKRVRGPMAWGFEWAAGNPPERPPHNRTQGEIAVEWAGGGTFASMEISYRGEQEAEVAWWVQISPRSLPPGRKARKTDMRVPIFGGVGQYLQWATVPAVLWVVVSAEGLDWRPGEYVEYWMRPVSIDGWPGPWERHRAPVPA